MLNSVYAELLLIRKRASTWILLGLWVLLTAIFGYVFEYVTYLTGNVESAQLSARIIPSQLVGTFLEGYPFFGGVIVLILGVLTFGSEYGWGTLKTVYTQRPGRVRLFAAKLAALGIVLAVFVVVPFVVSALLSYFIALREDVAIVWPGVWLTVRGVATGWFLLAVWAAFGSLLAVLSRGTALAIGIGILYGLVIEGLISAFVNDVSVLRPLAEGFIRANGYSLVEPLGIVAENVRDRGPGSFAGPYVGSLQASLVLAGYLSAFVLLAGLLLRRRDVV